MATVALASAALVVGTPEADAVEYLERAQGLVRAAPHRRQAIRSIGVSLLTRRTSRQTCSACTAAVGLALSSSASP